jgi:hypothetical protein
MLPRAGRLALVLVAAAASLLVLDVFPHPFPDRAALLFESWHALALAAWWLDHSAAFIS